MNFAATLDSVADGCGLGREAAREVMRLLMAGELPDAQVGGFLMALRAKGVAADELAGFAEALRENAITLHFGVEALVDTCGTGGGAPTFNLSTGAAILAASAGAKVAKHGNRAVTSACGSADVLEALGIPLTSDQGVLSRQLDSAGVTFLFAPLHHAGLKAVGPVRRALGVRTVFNQLGPLANPAGAKRQLVGVYDHSLLMPMAEALRLLGAETAFVVHSADGLDEASPCTETFYVHLSGEELIEGSFHPSDFGLDPLPLAAMAPGQSPEENAAFLREALTDPTSMRCKALLPNAALALWLGGMADGPRKGAAMALEAVASGAANRTLVLLTGAQG